MRIPLSWLKEFVPLTLAPKELAHRLTMAGLEVGEIEHLGREWEQVFVGLVRRVLPHPNADRLRLCEVDLGSERWTVVCGAPNVAEGQKIAFAKVGARLLDPRTGKVETLRPARIRGVLSEGMICSERELGLGDDHTGILVLPEDLPVGTPLAEALGDTVLEIEVTTNRPDAMSILGVAWEVGALTGQRVRMPDLAFPTSGEPLQRLVRVEVWDSTLCPRYTAALVRGVRVGPSPRWLQERLHRAGMRPINNVVDITNYVMLEYGQPLHAFDYDTLAQSTIIVRQARPGETLVTLDGQERRLAPPMLVIADAQRAIALAGIMGGANSEVTERTTTVLLESAAFEPFNTRRTAQALKVRTEASTRFEKGLRPHLPPVALRRAVQLLLQVAGGTAAPGIADAWPGRREETPLLLTARRLRQVLGMEVPLPQARAVLESLGFQVVSANGEALAVHPPFWRSDITIEDDLVEEVIRILGYDTLPTKTLSTPIPPYRPDPVLACKEQVRALLVSCGMQEVITYSLVSKEALERGGASPTEALRVFNPLNPQWEYLRTTLRPSILQTLAHNIPHAEGPLRLFEIGRVYLPRPADLPQEQEVIIGVMAGPRSPVAWLRDEGGLGFYDAKGVVEEVLTSMGLDATFTPTSDAFFLPGRCAHIHAGGRVVGILGEVHPQVAERFDLGGQTVSLFEITLHHLVDVLPAATRRYRPLPRYPGARRDLAVVVDRTIPAHTVAEVIQRHPLVAGCVLFDVYEGPPVPAGKRSLAYRITFQSPQRTLTAEEVEEALQQVLAALHQAVGAVRREG
ncbi:MAG: phenylalanine--tRNA ligase subunit beta [Dehalococcoidia bacterium]|nr:phenylalanine--tRNA ligase subunit beta [Dehalococcoidia bacterium]MDW8119568.1 phenylalanine--tRNA ligase subunit beta [Chloroflexota bacterium]